MSRMVPRFTDADPMVLAVEFEGERPLPQPGWCDEQAPRGATEPVGARVGPEAIPLALGFQKSPSGLPGAAGGHSAQKTSDAAHADPLRHNAARLARLAEAWVDNAMGLARSMERLREMHGLIDALERGWLTHLERHGRERELVGVGMSDRCMEDRA